MSDLLNSMNYIFVTIIFCTSTICCEILYKNVDNLFKFDSFNVYIPDMSRSEFNLDTSLLAEDLTIYKHVDKNLWVLIGVDRYDTSTYKIYNNDTLLYSTNMNNMIKKTENEFYLPLGMKATTNGFANRLIHFRNNFIMEKDSMIQFVEYQYLEFTPFLSVRVMIRKEYDKYDLVNILDWAKTFENINISSNNFN